MHNCRTVHYRVLVFLTVSVWRFNLFSISHAVRPAWGFSCDGSRCREPCTSHRDAAGDCWPAVLPSSSAVDAAAQPRRHSQSSKLKSTTALTAATVSCMVSCHQRPTQSSMALPLPPPLPEIKAAMEIQVDGVKVLHPTGHSRLFWRCSSQPISWPVLKKTSRILADKAPNRVQWCSSWWG